MSSENPGAVLKKIREAHGYTLTQLAKKAGVSHTTIRNYERGIRKDGSAFTPNEGKVMKVAAVFPPDERAEILEAYGMVDLARNARSEAKATEQPVSQEGQQFTVVGVVAGSPDTIIVRDDQGQHRIFRELKLGGSSIYGRDEAPF